MNTEYTIKMKGGPSSLNPYAESYVPLSKRGVAGVKKQLTSPGHGFKSANLGVTNGHHLWVPSIQSPQGNSIHTVETNYSAFIAKIKGHDFHGFLGSTSYNHKENADDQFELHLAYLQATFPSVSYKSLADVFVENNCDVDATVDLLNHLELYSGDSSAKLPDTLDIGDVPESGFSSEASAPYSKHFNIDASASSSDVSCSAPTNVNLGNFS